MKPIQLKREIESQLTNEHWVTSFDREQGTLRIIDKRVDKGLTINLANLAPKFEENKEQALEDTMKTIKEGLTLLTTEVKLAGNESHIFPVIRSTSFETETNDGRKLLHADHTAETRVFYAVDQGASYSLIDEEMLAKEGKTFQEIQEAAKFNLRSLKHTMKQDKVAGNTFYFLSMDDGYDASRILNESLLKEMSDKALGELAVAIPHHDVLIFADIQNETGYDVLAQMVFQFFSQGRVPLTALPFMYENGELEPIFILAQKKPKEAKKD
ncbi:DUF1444 domain-containing protein [Salipaludibacillus keqinensis]|uniref:DUF1444 domain-containing protein n=1 Tax=Salipaludibacillus keqinensis TaxID=2045207 RepID=A0A323TG24_9BACI|nr:DUF1444 domain-containing protein [Salipaludibacillus keqinensis]PYZ93791.1 DUF1444 domain-containing protein [Salipaludibacillus keqinensis]